MLDRHEVKLWTDMREIRTRAVVADLPLQAVRALVMIERDAEGPRGVDRVAMLAMKAAPAVQSRGPLESQRRRSPESVRGRPSGFPTDVHGLPTALIPRVAAPGEGPNRAALSS